ncbi:LysR family transcriptional regulator [Dyella sp. LX-66]|uniref:LysR substrate-binding domain-containing protein n=1 Tax=unclassified Dyella TaxID=2634549 RepID=UPI001BE0EF31|nr:MULTISPECIES: LysR family transcriptional regulator [unclassified Dyella]MBT2119125.1 LysR family transcriptional regulator [Dyella sp. LX-1]MBT2141496.1 LysR family transcriptional regulator [Dyella sp. LX-66]
MDRLQAMRIYVQIVERGSFSRAADSMQLHRPVVSKAIQELEQELGTRLLNRSTRKVSVTAEGDEFYRRCVQLLSGIDDAFAHFPQSRVAPKGRLRLDIAVTLAKAVVIPALPDFRRRYPQIEIVLGASDQPVDLVGEGVDCVVRLGELKDSSLVARRIGAVSMVTCASPGYLAQHGMPATLEELSLHKAVNFYSGRHRRIVDWTFRRDGEEIRLKLDSSMLTDDSEALLACGLAGLGLVQGVRPALEPYLNSGHLVEVLPHLPPSPKPISVMYPERAHLPAKTRVFVDWLTDLIGRTCPGHADYSSAH